MADKKLRVIIADDHPLIASALRDLLEREHTATVVAEVTDGHELLALCDREHPDLIVLDLQLPGLSGLECLRLIKARAPYIKIIVLSAFGDAETVRQVVAGGAEGFVLKTMAPQHLLEAITQVARGQLVYPRSAQRWLTHRPPVELSPFDEKLLSLLAKGFTNKELAQELRISPNTVKHHLKRLFRTLGVSNRTEAVSWYLRRLPPTQGDYPSG